MCERRTVLVALLTLALAVGGAGAQRTPPTEQELEARVQSLLPRWDEARRLAEGAEAAQAMVLPPAEAVDTLHVGPFTVLAFDDQAELARGLFEDEWDVFEPIFGSRIDFLLAEFPDPDRMGAGYLTFVFKSGNRQSPVGDRRPTWVEFEPGTTRAQMRRTIRLQLAEKLANLLPQRIWVWEGGLLLLPPTPQDFADVHRDLVLAKSPLGRSCLDGNAGACWIGMGALPAGADPIGTWFDADGQRGLVRSQPANAGEASVRALRQTCLDGDDGACKEFLELQNPIVLAPISAPVRSNLVWFALERGGRGALSRMFAGFPESPGDDIRARLVAASGLDSDELITEWRASIETGRSGSPIRPDNATASATMGWLLLLAGLATRSTRWRLG